MLIDGSEREIVQIFRVENVESIQLALELPCTEYEAQYHDRNAHEELPRRHVCSNGLGRYIFRWGGIPISPLRLSNTWRLHAQNVDDILDVHDEMSGCGEWTIDLPYATLKNLRPH